MQDKQHVLIFQQDHKAEPKIKGVTTYGKALFQIELISIEAQLPLLLEDSEGLLPSKIKADLVLDFLTHMDLSNDLSQLCQQYKIPLIASGKKLSHKWAITPPT